MTTPFGRPQMRKLLPVDVTSEVLDRAKTSAAGATYATSEPAAAASQSEKRVVK